MRTLRSALAVAALLAAGPLAHADDLLPADRSIPDAVDHYIDARLRQAGVTPAPPADDANLVRRLTLDLAGRIPTAAEARAYVAATDPHKKARLVDGLLASPGFVRHQAAELDTMLMQGTRGSLRDYLALVVAENRPWDWIFRELLLADESDPAQRGAAEFLKRRLEDPDKLTGDVSALFFGVNVSCARCHDHPLVPDWKQDHYFGMKSFFGRTFDNGGFLAERSYGVVKFKTVGGKEREARLMFLTGKVVEGPAARAPSPADQRREQEQLDAAKRKHTPPPRPRFSARAELVRLALEPGQRDFFARSIVNRFWFRFFGRGLVTPLDQMHAGNAPSHPDLLAWLARDLVTHGYDLRRLTRGLVLSRAYARASRRDGTETPSPELFAVAAVRPLTPGQLATSLRLATTSPDRLSAGLKHEELEQRIAGLEASARGFAELLDQPREGFQVSVAEALLFSNGDRMREFLADGDDRLVGRLKQTKDPDELIDIAVRNVLSRPPTAEERRLLRIYLADRPDRRVEACRQLVWALLASAEFRFNY